MSASTELGQGTERGCTPGTSPRTQPWRWAGPVLTARQSKHTKEALVILKMRLKKKGKTSLCSLNRENRVFEVQLFSKSHQIAQDQG